MCYKLKYVVVTLISDISHHNTTKDWGLHSLITHLVIFALVIFLIFIHASKTLVSGAFQTSGEFCVITRQMEGFPCGFFSALNLNRVVAHNLFISKYPCYIAWSTQMVGDVCTVSVLGVPQGFIISKTTWIVRIDPGGPFHAVAF